MHKLLGFLMTFLMAAHFLAAQTVSLAGPWKFRTGDDPDWKIEHFNDQD